MEEIIKVQGMSCDHCVRAIEESVGGLSGVTTVNVKLATGEVLVEFNDEALSLAQITETIEDQGYDVVS